MTRHGADMLLTISFMDGQFEMAGTATKGGAPPPAAAAGRGRGGSGAARQPKAAAAGPRHSRRWRASPT